MRKSNDILIPEFERLLQTGHMVEFIPTGISMRPFIEGGRDNVVLKTCTEPQVGDIVLAKVGQSFVLHRIYYIKNEQFILRGDGNLSGHEICSAKDIIGYVIRITDHIGNNKRLTKAYLWRYLPTLFKKIYLKIYRKTIIYQHTDYES